MSDSLFLIAGGGTGAKVAEALVHLCAAGMAPRRVHLLLVDADTTNGNLQRALQTARSYQGVQKWPWAVETTTGQVFGLGGKKKYLQIFGSALSVTTLTETLDTTRDGGIANRATPDEQTILDLLYDADEQTASCDDGFRARPNLGCLVLADHLADTLPAHAGPFLDALVKEAAAGQPVPVVVAASIFGGTGASLLPVVRGAVEVALKARDAERTVKMLAWGAAMILPHYQPARRIESVDPDRYLLDTANALQFYGMAQEVTNETLYDAIYAVGSDRPSRNIVEPVLGQKAQANPAYIEETVGALAVIHFAETLGQGRRATRVFQPDRGNTRLTWADLPLSTDERLRTRAAYLLHLGAFLLRPADPHRPDLSKGLAGLLATTPDAEIEAYAWFKDILSPWAAGVSQAYAQTPAGRRASALKDATVMGSASVDALRPAAVEYFGRLLLWAASALRDGTDGRGVLHLVDFHADGDYALLQGKMSAKGLDVDAPAEGAAAADPSGDNALARLLRTALAAEVAAHERTGAKGVVAGEFALVDADGRIGLRITPEQVRQALAAERLGEVADEYTRTAPATA
ncbi:MAG TPA: hypothetical protein VGB53_08080 [Rubricoccaceae bacterium]|jgi:hypothetical protein